jgi:hypothetical protein
MPYAIDIGAWFPTRPTLATVGYTPAGLPRVTAGVVEDGDVPGLYLATATLPDGWSGVIEWDTGEGVGSLHAYEVVNPPGTAATTAQAATVTTGAGPLEQVYCTDEDIAARALDDYPVLVPSWQVQALGTDGVFDPGYPWLLRSASVDFLAAKVHARQVVHLTKPAAQFRGEGTLLTVEGVSTDGSSVQLRRIGKAPGLGQPPAPAAGLSGVEFAIRTFDTQIDKASYDANKIFNIGQGDPQLTSGNLAEPRELEQWTVLTVLGRAYAARLKERREDFGIKLQEIRAELAELKGRISVRWGPRGELAPASSEWGRLQVRR